MSLRKLGIVHHTVEVNCILKQGGIINANSQLTKTRIAAPLTTELATGAEMDVIAACVIGGVSLNGGQGNAVGVLLGAITIAIISKSLSLVGIDAFWQQALKGAIILAAVVINVVVQRNAARKALEGREI